MPAFLLRIANMEVHSLLLLHMEKGESGKPSVNWEGLAKGVDTIAFFTWVSQIYLGSVKNLVRYGKRPETPVILIQWGTMGRQKKCWRERLRRFMKKSEC
ncbi:hypothetical protein GCM10020331_076820 [Ectobacillus funiculus]